MSKTVIAPFTDEEMDTRKRPADEEDCASDDDHEDSDSDAGESDHEDASSEPGDASDQDEDDDDDDDAESDDEPAPESSTKKAGGSKKSAASAAGNKPQTSRSNAIRSKQLSQAEIDRDYTTLYMHKPSARELEQQKKLCTQYTKFSDFVAAALDFERDCSVIKHNKSGAISYVTRVCTAKEAERSKKAGSSWRDLTPSMLGQMPVVKVWLKANLAALKGGASAAELTSLFGDYPAPTVLIESHRSRPARGQSRAAPATSADGKTANGRKRTQPRAKTTEAVQPLSQAAADLQVPPPAPVIISPTALAEVIRGKLPATDKPVSAGEFFARVTMSRIAEPEKWNSVRTLAICGATTELVGAMDIHCGSFVEQQKRLMKVCAEGASQPGFTMQYCLASNVELARIMLLEFAKRQGDLADETTALRANVAALRYAESMSAKEIQALKDEAESKAAGAKAAMDELAATNATLKTKLDAIASELAAAKKMLKDGEQRAPAPAAVASKPAHETPGADTVAWISSKSGKTTKSNGSSSSSGSSSKPKNGTSKHAQYGGKSPKSAVAAVAQAPAAELSADLFD